MAPASHQLGVRLERGSTETVTFQYSQPDPTVLELQGQLEGAPTLIRLKQRPLEKYALVRHRFRWTSDL